MTRCSRPGIAAFVCAASVTLALGGLAPTAQAQVNRLFPQGTKRGTMTFVEPPQVLLDNKPVRLGPGTRVHDEKNRIALHGTLRGKTAIVNYVRDVAGVPREVWILTPAEIERDQRFGVIEQPGRAPEYLN